MAGRPRKESVVVFDPNLKYKGCNQEVNDDMDLIEQYLIQKYGKLEPVWAFSLKNLAMNKQMLLDVTDAINKVGVAKATKLLFTRSQLESKIQTAIENFGLTPKAQSKIKQQQSSSEQDELIHNILGDD